MQCIQSDDTYFPEYEDQYYQNKCIRFPGSNTEEVIIQLQECTVSEDDDPPKIEAIKMKLSMNEYYTTSGHAQVWCDDETYDFVKGFQGAGDGVGGEIEAGSIVLALPDRDVILEWARETLLLADKDSKLAQSEKGLESSDLILESSDLIYS